MSNDTEIMTPSTITEAVGAIAELPERAPHDAIDALCVDVRSCYAALDAGALAVVADLRSAGGPEFKVGADDYNQRLEKYRNTLRDLVAIREVLDEHKVTTEPMEEGSNLRQLWGDYTDRIASARTLRLSL